MADGPVPACGWASGTGDIVQNCFGYHLTPAGMIFENGARAVGAAVLPAGTGQTELQVRAARDIGMHRLCRHARLPEGDPRQGRRDGRDAAHHQGGGRRRGAVPVAAAGLCRSRASPACSAMPPPIWATSPMKARRMEGMIVDEGVIVEIVHPGHRRSGRPRARWARSW